MTTSPSDILAEAFSMAMLAGLRLLPPEEQRSWLRLTCPACGAALDLPIDEQRGPAAVPRRLRHVPAVWYRARRVAAFTHRHLPGRVHQ